jgi:hypothetical protein
MPIIVIQEALTMSHTRRIVAVTLIAAGLAIPFAGCTNAEKKESGSAAAAEHPKGEHPKGEHPKGEHPKGEHPKGEHPK